MYTEFQILLFQLVAIVFNGLSIISSTLVLGSYFYLRKKQPHLLDRVSLRLAASISFADLIYSMFQIPADIMTQPGAFCTFSVWGYITFGLLSLFFTIAVAANIQVIFINGKRDARYLEKWYFGLSIGCALMIGTSGLIAGQYGWDERVASCWFVNDGNLTGTLWLFFTSLSWMIMAILYCFTVVFLVLWRVSRESKEVDALSTLGVSKVIETTPLTRYNTASPMAVAGLLPGVKKVANTKLKQAERRRKRRYLLRVLRHIALYPTVPVLTQPWVIATTLTPMYLGEVPYGLLVFTIGMNSLQGFLNSVVFFLDPSINAAMAEQGWISEWLQYSRRPSHNEAAVIQETQEEAQKPSQVLSAMSGDTLDSPVLPTKLLDIEIEVGWRFQTDDWFRLL